MQKQDESNLGTCNVCNLGCCNCETCVGRKGRKNICQACVNKQKEKENAKAG